MSHCNVRKHETCFCVVVSDLILVTIQCYFSSVWLKEITNHVIEVAVSNKVSEQQCSTVPPEVEDAVP